MYEPIGSCRRNLYPPNFLERRHDQITPSAGVELFRIRRAKVRSRLERCDTRSEDTSARFAPHPAFGPLLLSTSGGWVDIVFRHKYNVYPPLRRFSRRHFVIARTF